MVQPFTDPNEDFGTGRCVNCGLLAIIDGDGAVREVPMPIRMGWVHPSDPVRCLIYRRHLSEELVVRAQEKGTPAEPYLYIAEAIRREQDCESWFGYIEGLSPQEHLQRRDIIVLEDQRQAFQRMLEDERVRREAETSKVGMWLAIAGVLFAAGEVVAAAISLTPDSWLCRMIERIS